MTNIEFNEEESILKFVDVEENMFELKVLSEFSLNNLLKYMEEPIVNVKEKSLRYYIAKELEESFDNGEQKTRGILSNNIPNNMIDHFIIEGEISKISCRLIS